MYDLGLKLLKLEHKREDRPEITNSQVKYNGMAVDNTYYQKLSRG